MFAARRASLETPFITSPPSIYGNPYVGNFLLGLDGQWAGPPTIPFTHQWMRCDSSGNSPTPIGGATGSQYTLQQSDVGSTMRLQVTTGNDFTTASALSEPSGIVADIASLGSYATAVVNDHPFLYCRANDGPSGPNTSTFTTPATDLTGHMVGEYFQAGDLPKGSGGGAGTYGYTLGVSGATSDGDTAVNFGNPGPGGLQFGYPTLPANIFRLTNLTVEAWVRATGTGSLMSQFDSTSNTGWEFWCASGHIWWRIYNHANRSSTISATDTLATSVWAHIAATFDGSTGGIYINGSSVVSGAMAGPLTNAINDPILIADGPIGSPFWGDWDEIAVYPTALSSSAIHAHYLAR